VRIVRICDDREELLFRNDSLELGDFRIVKEKSTIHIVPGLLGFVGISVVCLTLQTVVDIMFARLISSVQTATITDVVVEGFLLGILFAILMWLATKTEYVSKTVDMRRDT